MKDSSEIAMFDFFIMFVSFLVYFYALETLYSFNRGP